MSHTWHKVTGHSKKAEADRQAAEEAQKIAAETQRITAQAEQQRKAAEADRQAAEERARVLQEQNDQAENAARGKEANASDLTGMGFGEGQGDGGGSALTGLGGVDPNTLTLGRRRRLGGGN